MNSANTFQDTAPTAAVGQKLFRFGALAVSAVIAYYLLWAKTEDFVNRLQALTILFLGALPALLWAKSEQKRFPLIEVFFLTTINSYALPLLNGHADLKLYSTETITTSAWIVISFQSALLITYHIVGGTPKRGRFWTEELLTADACRYLNYGTVINTLYLIESIYFDLLPPDLNSILRAICFGIGIVCTFVTAQLWGLGKLSPSERSFFIVNLVIQTVMQLTSLFLVGALSTIILCLLGYVTRKRKVPVVLVGIILLFTALLHNGKPQMREKYWHTDGPNQTPSITELPGFFAEWIGYSLNPPELGEDPSNQTMTSKLIQRTSLFQMVCLVAENTPKNYPFLDGDTYSDIIAQFVPRFLWPGKPTGLLSTYKLSIYYGLQSEEGTAQTTIAFGQVAEAYANFGFFGVIGLGVFIGVFYKKAQTWAADSPMISYPGILLVILMAWSFQNEFTLSVWLASLYQSCIAIMALLMGVKMFLK